VRDDVGALVRDGRGSRHRVSGQVVLKSVIDQVVVALKSSHCGPGAGPVGWKVDQ